MNDPRPVVLVSNRGPVSFRLDDDGVPVAHRGAGGLVSGLGPIVRGTDTIWIAAAMGDGDRRVAADGLTTAEDFRIRLLDIDPETFDLHYDEVCNTALWFAHHGLFDPVYEPAWQPGRFDAAWAAHRRVNEAFADAIVETAPPDAVVMVQDYHLCLVAPSVRSRRSDLRLVHFSHTPFATPLHLRMLPDEARLELLRGLGAHHACGFHTERWLADHRACCADAGIEPAPCFVAPLGPDRADLEATRAGDRSRTALEELERTIGDRRSIVRVDRIELSKNVLRGFDAYDALLDMRPDLRGNVVFGAYLYPSRSGVADYDRYRRAVETRVEEVNARHRTDGWTPIVLDTDDDFPRSVAALARADVVIVNPIRDGLNLVAKEAMILGERHPQLVLSPEAGAWEELGDAAWRAHPFDVAETAAALAAALDAPVEERRRRHSSLRAASLARTPMDWFQDQIAAAGC